MHRDPAQVRFTEEEGSDTEAARIVEQILAKLGPGLRQSRELRRHPPTPRLQHVRSVEREMSQSGTRDTYKSKNGDKPVERSRGRSPSMERSQSRNREGPSQCFKCKGYGHIMRDCPSGDFYVMGLNGLSVKKREASQESPKSSDSPATNKTLN